MDTGGVEFEVVSAVTYGSSIIPYEVVRTRRATLAIQVHPDGRVEVRAPQESSDETVRDLVARRARWILRQQRYFAELVEARPEKEYVGGETHHFLGHPYRIRIEPAACSHPRIPAEAAEGVTLSGRYLVVRSQAPAAADHTRALLEAWYREQARRVLHERFGAMCREMSRYGIGAPVLVVRAMQKRWGSCTPGGRVLANPRLVLAPTSCIDYVLVHELCHLKHPHHGPAFYELLERVLPDWRERKERLEQIQ